MGKDFYVGMVLGLVGGAALLFNVPKAKKFYEKSQKFVVTKLKGMCKQETGSKKQEVSG